MPNLSASTAAKAERDRIAAIIALPEAKGREEYTMTLAVTTDLSVDQVKAKLAAETSALWDAALASRGIRTRAQTPDGTSWEASLKSRGMKVG